MVVKKISLIKKVEGAQKDITMDKALVLDVVNLSSIPSTI